MENRRLLIKKKNALVKVKRNLEKFNQVSS